MSDSRIHRGPHPEDVRLFAADKEEALRSAVRDLCWLLSHGYQPVSALKLVGDRFALSKRQRTAITRASCSQEAKQQRKANEIGAEGVAGRDLCLDGFNLITTIEAALSGGIILSCVDGTYRDLASMHGTWRKVTETTKALEIIFCQINQLQPKKCIWYLDRPISNSGRLKEMLLRTSAMWEIPCNVELVNDPDRELKSANGVVATSDSQILNHCKAWYNLARRTVETEIPSAWVLHLG